VTGDEIPDTDNVTRLCSLMHLNDDGWPEGAAFVLKTNEPYLSVNWLESLGIDDRADQIVEVLRVLSTKRKVAASAKLALINVAEAKAAVKAGSADRLDISFLHDPEDGQFSDPSHSGIYNLPLADTDISAAEQLALAVRDVFPTR
jgi:hypothetical protein